MIIVEKTYRDLTVATANLIKGYSEPTIVFCEDKNTLSLEMEVVKRCGGTFNCEITTLNRYLRRLVNIDKVCSKHTQALIIKKILSSEEKNLKIFKSLSGYSVAGAISELISQLKSARVTPEALRESASGFSGVFKNKIEDVSLIFSRYETYLEKNSLLDINNKFSLLVEALQQADLSQFRIIVSGFQAVTAQTAQAFSIMAQKAKSIDFVCLRGERIYTNEVYNFAKGLNLEEVKEKNSEHERYRLLDFLYEEEEKEGLYSDKIRIFEYGDHTEEIISVAEEIKKKVINGARYKDFMLVCADYLSNKSLIKKIFADYEIPYFAEDNFLMSDHPLIRAIAKFVEVFSRTFDMDEYKKFIRNTALFSNRDFVDEYILHLDKYAYSEKAIKNPLEEKEEKFEEFRALSLSFSLPQKALAQKYVDAILQMLSKLEVEKNLEKIALRLEAEKDFEHAEFIKAGYQKTLELLGEISAVLGFDEITSSEFKSIFLSGASYMEFAVIPQRDDRVYLGDFSSCKYRFAEHLYITGLSADYPSAMADTAIFSDTDLKRLDKIKLVIDPKLEIVNKRNKEDLCVTLAGFEKSLTVSYSIFNAQGEEKLPCEAFAYIENAFSDKNASLSLVKKSLYKNLIKRKGTAEQKEGLIADKYLTDRVAIKSFATALSSYKFSNGEDEFSSYYSIAEKRELTDKLLALANAKLTLKTEGMGELFFKDQKVSVSTIEKYFSCPFANFLSNGLKLKEDEDGEVKVFEFGNLLHSVCEKFIDLLIVGAVNSLEEVEMLAKELIEALLRRPEYAKYNKRAQNRKIFSLLLQEAKKVLTRLYLDTLKTDFKPKFVELEFGFDTSKKKGIKLKTTNGDYEVRGKIDRVDTCDNLVRIIDYKSGKTKEKVGSSYLEFENERLLYTGKKLQLYLYLNLFLDEGMLPSGVYYSQINDEYKKDGDKDGISLQGKTVSEPEILAKTDKEMGEDGKSEIIGSIYRAKGKFSDKTCISSSRLISYAKYARALTAKAVEEIKNGQTIVSPSEGACEYCGYKGICGLEREKFDTERKIPKVSAEDIENLTSGGEK